MSEMKPIAIGCDEAAYDFKEIIKEMLIEKGYEVEDYGTYDNKPVLYPDIAFAVHMPLPKASITEDINLRYRHRDGYFRQ